MQEETEELLKFTTKIIKPYLRYFHKCAITKEKNSRMFQIIGVDVIYDQDLHPWLLELNSSPSMCIEFDPEDYMKNKKSEPLISPIDLHVKSAVVADGVKLCKKSIHKILEIEKMGIYKKIFDPEIEIEEMEEYCIIDSLVDVFFKISGVKFNSSLSMTNFSKIIKYLKNIGPVSIEKVNIDITYKKVMLIEGTMDFYGFMIGLDMLLEVAFGKGLEIGKKERLEKFLLKFRSG